MILEITYTEGERIPTTDWAAYAIHGKERTSCLVVGCDNASDCEVHWLPPDKVQRADAAYDKGCNMAMAYCWGRGDMGDAVANDQANWYPFTRAYGRMQFAYVMEKRAAAWSVRTAWERFVQGEEL